MAGPVRGTAVTPGVTWKALAVVQATKPVLPTCRGPESTTTGNDSAKRRNSESSPRGIHTADNFKAMPRNCHGGTLTEAVRWPGGPTERTPSHQRTALSAVKAPVKNSTYNALNDSPRMRNSSISQTHT